MEQNTSNGSISRRTPDSRPSGKFFRKFYEVSSCGVDEETEQIDYDQLLSQAEKVQPKMITAGASACQEPVDFGKMLQIAKIR